MMTGLKKHSFFADVFSSRRLAFAGRKTRKTRGAIAFAMFALGLILANPPVHAENPEIASRRAGARLDLINQ
jgi:hypothetical protein